MNGKVDEALEAVDRINAQQAVCHTCFDSGRIRQGCWGPDEVCPMCKGKKTEPRDSAETATIRAALEQQRVPDGWNLIKHLHRQKAFSLSTFGPGPRTSGVLDHIRKEVREVEAEPGSIEEWVDIALLALDGAWRTGATPQEIVAAIDKKMDKNEQRDWPDWRTAEPGKAIEHVKVAPDPNEAEG